MGRQIALIATPHDERNLLDFIRSSAPIRIFRTVAHTQAELWVEKFDPSGPYAWQYRIWNTDFPWTPTYGQVNADVPGHGGWFFVRNFSVGPVIEYSRANTTRQQPGRLYWAKAFSATEPLQYDTVKFANWYEQIVKWVRKNGKKDGNQGAYVLPNARSMAS
jgi:hypothetical protein